MDFTLGFLGRLNLQDLPYVIITLVIAFTIHEFAHAYVAYKFGDHTAKNQGRLTLNPMVHLDPIGTLVLIFAGFGWARPVPVNRYNFKNPRLAGVLTSVAGPVSNLVLAIIGGALHVLLAALSMDGKIGFFLSEFFTNFIWINIVLFVFNLLPIPPLDGHRIVQDLVSNRTRAKLSQYEVYGMIILLIIFIVPEISSITIGPIFNYLLPLIYNNIHYFFFNVFGL